MFFLLPPLFGGYPTRWQAPIVVDSSKKTPLLLLEHHILFFEHHIVFIVTKFLFLELLPTGSLFAFP